MGIDFGWLIMKKLIEIVTSFVTHFKIIAIEAKYYPK